MRYIMILAFKEVFMPKKYIVIVVTVIVLFSIVFMVKQNQDRYSQEMSYEILNYEEVPKFVKDKINDGLKLKPSRSDSTIKTGDGYYIVLIPPENEAVEVKSVEKESFNGIIYRYRYVDKNNDNLLDNMKIIKISNFHGSITGSFTSD